MGRLARGLSSVLLLSLALALGLRAARADEPSFLYVMTQREIAGTGAHNLPDVLRAMPGIHVTGRSERDWAVTAAERGDDPSARLLVLVDGRRVASLGSGLAPYAPEQLLREIDRIELIRGPGAALWGPSASNGIVHIITKKARYTQGVLRPHRGG